jgi:hypothetical protein
MELGVDEVEILNLDDRRRKNGRCVPQMTGNIPHNRTVSVTKTNPGHLRRDTISQTVAEPRRQWNLLGIYRRLDRRNHETPVDRSECRFDRRHGLSIRGKSLQ